MNEAKAVREMAEAALRLEKRHGYFVLQMPFGDVLTLVAQLQLALRHPGNKGHSAKETRRIVDDIIEALGKTEPKLAELLRMGDNPAHDVKSS